MSTASRRPQTSKRAAVERAVLEAVGDLLAEGSSYSELSIERIATRAGISRTAFYFYFDDKRELLMRLAEDTSQLLFGEAERWWAATGDAQGALRDALARIVALYRDHGLVLRAVVESSSSDEIVAGFWRSLVGRFVQATGQRVQADPGTRRPSQDDADAIAFALVWATERVCYQQLVQGHPLADEQLLGVLTELWLKGVYGPSPAG